MLHYFLIYLLFGTVLTGLHKTGQFIIIPVSGSRSEQVAMTLFSLLVILAQITLWPAFLYMFWKLRSHSLSSGHHRHTQLESACPSCGHLVNAAYGEHTRKPPEEGDVAICAHCNSINIYDSNRKLTRPSTELQKELENNPDIQAALESLGKFKEHMGIDN